MEVPLVGVRETPITAMEFTISWPALYLNENYVFWVIGQWLKDPTKSGDMTQLGLLECCYKFKIFFSFFNILYTARNDSNIACGMRMQDIEQRTQVTQDQICVIKEHILLLILF